MGLQACRRITNRRHSTTYSLFLIYASLSHIWLVAEQRRIDKVARVVLPTLATLSILRCSATSLKRYGCCFFNLIAAITGSVWCSDIRTSALRRLYALLIRAIWV